MSPQDHEDFFCDVSKVDMVKTAKTFMNGIQRYYINEDLPGIDSGFTQVIQKNQFNFAHDIRYARDKSSCVSNKNLSDLFPDVLS